MRLTQRFGWIVIIMIICISCTYAGELAILTQIGLGSKDTTGIKNAGKVISSSNGRDIYIGSNNHGLISQFLRDSTNGFLTFVASTDSIPYITDMVLSPDERFLYVATLDKNTLECYSRDVFTGSLKFSSRIEINPNQNWFDIPFHLCLNQPGKNLYVVSDDAVSVFSRDSLTGLLSFRQMLLDERGGITELAGASSIDISHDGKTAYVASYKDSCISWYHVDSTTGTLSYTGMVRANGNNYYVLKSPDLVRVSENGKYVIASSSGALAWFTRNQVNGELTFGGELLCHNATLDGLYEIDEFRLFAGGTRLVTAAGVSSGLFSVDTSNGKIFWLETTVIPPIPNQFHHGTSVALCANNIYVTGYDGTLTILKWTQNIVSVNYFNSLNNRTVGLNTGCLSDLLGRKVKLPNDRSHSSVFLASHGSLYSKWISERK
ncbi:MAG TPA: beta-propeller fold lactonase family protein [Chitinispirillaceae bacterium]|nr:beta-propeller fold lactonase family protein [Chitinispirillaceae bacterium]